MNSNCYDARHYKRSNSNPKQQDNETYQQKKTFSAPREECQSTQIINISRCSPIQEELHKALEDLKPQVNSFPNYVHYYLIPYLKLKAQSFTASHVSLEKWIELTSDPHILRIIAGETIESFNSSKHSLLTPSVKTMLPSLTKRFALWIKRELLSFCDHDQSQRNMVMWDSFLNWRS